MYGFGKLFFSLKSYSIKNNLTGQCLIINLSTRTGAKIDEDRFEKLFKKLILKFLITEFYRTELNIK